MAFLKEIRGVLIGIGLALVAPALLKRGRPLARAAVKAGIILGEQARESLTRVGEDLADLVAEARIELAAEAGIGERVDIAARDRVAGRHADPPKASAVATQVPTPDPSTPRWPARMAVWSGRLSRHLHDRGAPGPGSGM
ncbi:MAG: DUF5132 domain-containing protein [Anaerolineae bacterium]